MKKIYIEAIVELDRDDQETSKAILDRILGMVLQARDLPNGSRIINHKLHTAYYETTPTRSDNG